MPVKNFVKLQPLTRVLGCYKAQDALLLQWSTDPPPLSQPPKSAYQLTMPFSEAWRLMQHLAFVYDQCGRPPLPED